MDLIKLKYVNYLAVGYKPPPTDAVTSVTIGMDSQFISLRSKMITIRDRLEVGSLHFSMDREDSNRISIINNNGYFGAEICNSIRGAYENPSKVLALKLNFKASSVEIYPSVFPDFIAMRIVSGGIVTMIGSPEYDIENYIFIHELA